MSWRTVTLKRVASIRVSNVDKKSVDGEPSVRLCNYTDVYYRDSIKPEQDFMLATASPEQIAAFRVQAGDVIITKDSEAADDIGVPTYVEVGAPDLVCGYHLALIRPRPNVVDGRFLFWTMASALMRSQLEVAATGITRYGLRSDAIGGATLRLPPLSDQRAIADILDAETVRIDALIEKKCLLMAKLRERLQAVLDHQLDRISTSWTTLRRHTMKIGSGKTPHGGAETYVLSGVIFLRSQNVGDGTLLLDDVAYIRDEVDEEMRPTRVKSGDVLLNITGASIGRVATVPPSFGKANVNQHVCIIRLHKGLIPELIEFNLRSSHAQRFIESIQVGGNRDGLNFDQVGSIPVVLPRFSEQVEVMRTLKQAEDEYKQIREMLNRQLELLAERRQALITAAMTGELNIGGTSA